MKNKIALIYLSRISFKNSIVLLVLVFCCGTLSKANNAPPSFLEMMNKCDDYIRSYTPLYYRDTDTFIVARFNKVPDDINNFLFKCAEKNDLRPLKYSAALIIRHNVEYNEVNKFDYMIGDGLLLDENGFIALLRKAMKWGKTNDNIDTMNYFPFFTGDVCAWINQNKKLIDDYSYVAKYIKALENKSATDVNKLKLKKAPKECIAYNDSAISLFTAYTTKGEVKETQLNTVLMLLNQATECDSSYFIGLSNKVMVLNMLGNFKEEIVVINNLLQITKRDPEVLIMKGIAIEKMGFPDSASTYYQEAGPAYDAKIIAFPDSLNIVISEVIYETFMGNQNKANLLLDKYQTKHPDEKLINYLRQMILNFNRNEFIQSYGNLNRELKVKLN